MQTPRVFVLAAEQTSGASSWVPCQDDLGFSHGTGNDPSPLTGVGRREVQRTLDRYGAILFRGVGREGSSYLRSFIEATSTTPMAYEERSSPRTEVQDSIYTSTEHPADQEIFLHNEHSYARKVPQKIYFHCVEPAPTGGQTPIADCRKVLARLRSSTRAKFARLGWMHVRNFGCGLGLDWRESFGTDDKAQVETYCKQHQIEWEWGPGGTRLRTRQRQNPISAHPRTDEEVWFNHVAFFHVSTLPADLFETLVRILPPEELPNNTYYGDGSDVEPDVLDEIRNAYAAESKEFVWEKGDILMLDNIAIAHGRTAFAGKRTVLVGMSEPWLRE